MTDRNEELQKLLRRLELLARSGRRTKSYEVLCYKEMNEFTDNLVRQSAANLNKHSVSWKKFEDGTDQIDIDILAVSKEYFAGRDLIFVACFHSNDATMSQLHLIAYLCELQPASLIVLLPFFSTGTMERIAYGEETRVPTANTLAMLFNGMPSFGRPLQFMTYDIHALQEQFYFSNHSVSRLCTAIPLLIAEIKQTDIDCIAFPDDGANKRFGGMFQRDTNNQPVLGQNRMGFEIVTFKKTREKMTESDGTERVVKTVAVLEGDPRGKRVVIVDDQVKSGGTLFQCVAKLKDLGATSVSIYVTHAVFVRDFWSHFAKASENLELFYVTDSMPTKCNEIKESHHAKKFKVLPLASRVIEDLFDHSVTKSA